MQQIEAENDDRLEPPEQLDVHLEHLISVTQELAAALQSGVDGDRLQQQATELEASVARLRVLMGNKGVIPMEKSDADLCMADEKDSKPAKH